MSGIRARGGDCDGRVRRSDAPAKWQGRGLQSPSAFFLSRPWMSQMVVRKRSCGLEVFPISHPVPQTPWATAAKVPTRPERRASSAAWSACGVNRPSTELGLRGPMALAAVPFVNPSSTEVLWSGGRACGSRRQSPSPWLNSRGAPVSKDGGSMRARRFCAQTAPSGTAKSR
jgi:hypothetical protein